MPPSILEEIVHIDEVVPRRKERGDRIALRLQVTTSTDAVMFSQADLDSTSFSFQSICAHDWDIALGVPLMIT